MTQFLPVQDEDGSLYWQDEDGELYEMDQSDQYELRMSALEQQQAEFAAQGEQGQEGLSPEEWNWEVAGLLEQEQVRLGRPLTSKEIQRFASHVEQTGEVPELNDWKPHSLDTEEGRQSWLTEMASADAPEPYSSKTEQAQTTEEGE